MISMSEVPAEIERVNKTDEISRGAAMNSFWVDIPVCSLSPDTQEYNQWVFDTYKSIARRDYGTDEELSPFFTDDLFTTPFPYNTRNAHIVGEQLMAIGYVIQAMDLPPASSIFEMGYGWGNTMLQMARMGYKVSGFDIDARYADLVRRQAVAMHVSVDARQGKFFDIEKVEEKFDAVLFFESFHHCDDHVRLLEAIPDRLKEGGKLVLAGEAINNKLPFPWGINPGGQAIYCIQEYGWLELCFREDYLLGLLDKMGWNVVKHSFPLSATGITYVATRRA